MNSQLSPDVRADLILKELTLDEKIDLLHGNGMRGVSKPRPNRIRPRCFTRELRNGRSFEYQGEDPILAGTLAGDRIKCEQAQHVLGDIKHYAVNDQESSRNEVNAIISKHALHESDLLATLLMATLLAKTNTSSPTFSRERPFRVSWFPIGGPRTAP